MAASVEVAMVVLFEKRDGTDFEITDNIAVYVSDDPNGDTTNQPMCGARKDPKDGTDYSCGLTG